MYHKVLATHNSGQRQN